MLTAISHAYNMTGVNSIPTFIAQTLPKGHLPSSLEVNTLYLTNKFLRDKYGFHFYDPYEGLKTPCSSLFTDLMKTINDPPLETDAQMQLDLKAIKEAGTPEELPEEHPLVQYICSVLRADMVEDIDHPMRKLQEALLSALESTPSYARVISRNITIITRSVKEGIVSKVNETWTFLQNMAK